MTNKRKYSDNDMADANRRALEKWCDVNKDMSVDQVIEFSKLTNHEDIMICSVWFCQMLLFASGLDGFRSLTELADALYYSLKDNESDFENFYPPSISSKVGGTVTIKSLFKMPLVLKCKSGNFTAEGWDYCREEKLIKQFFSMVSERKFVEFISALQLLFSIVICRNNDRGVKGYTGSVDDLFMSLPGHARKSEKTLTKVKIEDLVLPLILFHNSNGGFLCEATSDLADFFLEEVLVNFIEKHSVMSVYFYGMDD